MAHAVHDLPPSGAPGAARLLRHDVFRELRQDILACRLTPGAELREAELAERFAVSKSPVRDALSRLVQEGLVQVMPRQGYRVAPITLQDVSDMCDYRAVLESACARAASAAPAEALRALDRFRVFDPAAHPEGFLGYNRDFHAEIARLAGNARLAHAVQGQMEQMDRVITLSLDALRQRDPARVVLQHGEIIDALQRGDARRAGTLVTRHIAEARKRVCAALARLAVLA